MCLCADLPTVPTATRIIVLQHPHEQRHPFGTARFVRLCMPDAEVHVAHGGNDEVLHCPIDVPPGTAVLYPHADAEDLETMAEDELPPALLVLDGTWGHAKTLYRHNPWLQQLRHVRLTPREPSRYRIRKEPQEDYISTLEAIVAALRITEPANTRVEELLVAFDRMIDQQIAHVATAERQHRTRRERQRPSRALPAGLFADNLLIAYAESSLPGGDPDQARELVQWVAVRVDTGETFEALLRPRERPPTAAHLEHMQIPRAALDAGLIRDAARAAFAEFAGPAPTIATWTATTLEWGTPLLPPDATAICLKTAYCNLRNRRAGYLEEVVQREHLTTVPLECSGRARNRLGNALAVARWLRRVGTVPGTNHNRAAPRSGC